VPLEVHAGDLGRAHHLFSPLSQEKIPPTHTTGALQFQDHNGCSVLLLTETLGFTRVVDKPHECGVTVASRRGMTFKQVKWYFPIIPCSFLEFLPLVPCSVPVYSMFFPTIFFSFTCVCLDGSFLRLFGKSRYNWTNRGLKPRNIHISRYPRLSVTCSVSSLTWITWSLCSHVYMRHENVSGSFEIPSCFRNVHTLHELVCRRKVLILLLNHVWIYYESMKWNS
jgi:hypothetical protein